MRKRKEIIESLKEVRNITLNSNQFLPDRVTYTVGKDAQQLSNEPHWVEGRWGYIETEELAALLKVTKQDEEE